MSFRPSQLVCLLFLPLLVVAGCTGESTTSESSGIPSGETVVLRVGNRFLTGNELHRKTDRALESYRANRKAKLTEKENSRLRKQFTRRILRKTIVNFLLLSAARDERVSVSDEALANRWRMFRDNFDDTKALDAHLEKTGQSRAKLKKHLRQNLILKEYLERIVSRVDPTDNQLREFFQENRDQFVNSSDTGATSFEEVRAQVSNAYRIRSQERQLRNHLRELWDRYEIELVDRSLSKDTFFEQLNSPASLLSQ